MTVVMVIEQVLLVLSVIYYCKLFFLSSEKVEGWGSLAVESISGNLLFG